MKAAGLRLYQFSKWLLLIILLLLALVNIGGRTLLANAEIFRNQIEQQLADYGIRGVVLDNITAHWEGIQPVLEIQGGSLSIPGRSHALSVSSLELRVQLFESLLRGELVLESFYSHIEKMVLVRDKKGAWWLNDIALTQHESITSSLDIYAFFQRLPTFVNIDIGLIQLRDLRHGDDYLIQQGRLRSSRNNRQLSLALDARLPATLGRDFHLLLSGDKAKQSLYIDAPKLNLRQWLQLTLVEKTHLKQAMLDFRGWMDLDKFRVSRIVSSARVSELAFNAAAAANDAYGFSLLQEITHQDGRWNMSGQLTNLTKGTQSFQDSDFQLRLDGAAKPALFWLSQLDVSLLRSLLRDMDVQQPLLQKIVRHRAQGRLRNLSASIDRAHPLQSLVGFDVEKLSFKREGSMPGVTPVSGHALYAAGKLRLQLAAKDFQMDFGDLFPAPLQLGEMSVIANARVEQDTLLLDLSQLSLANQDLKLKARMWLEQQGEQRPYVYMRGQYQDGRIASTPHYLPVKIMPPAVVDWLNKSLLGGRIKQGDFIFHGRLKKPSILHKTRAGMMQASFAAEKLQVKFLPGWPRVKAANGRVNFINASLDAHFSKSRLATATVSEMQLDIADFYRAAIAIQAQAKTSASQLLDTLAQLPTLDAVDTFRQNVKAVSGRVDTRLKLHIPLSDTLGDKFSISAKSRLQDVKLDGPEWMIKLDKLSGDIEMENDLFRASNLTARYYGDKVDIKISPQQKNTRTLIRMSGNIQTRSLLQLTPDYISRPVSGVSLWVATVSVAHDPSPHNPLLEINAHSSLLGCELNFPRPLRIENTQQQLIAFDARLYPRRAFDFKLSMNDLLSANGRINLKPGAGNSLQYLNIALQDAQPARTDSGITLSGRADAIESVQWMDFIKRYFPATDKDAPPFLQQVKSVDIRVDHLMIGKQQAQQAVIRLVNNGKELRGDIDSSLARGDLIVPYRATGDNPLVAKLDYIRLKKTKGKEKFDPRIEDMPNLLITSSKISFEKMEVNDFALATRNEGDTFLIKQLDFSRGKVQLKSSGLWQKEAKTDEQVSVFNISIKGKNFGKVVKGLGLGETIQGGDIDFSGQIGWAGALFNINWPTLIGEVKLNLKNGYLKNVDPGAGRFVGLLSFNALPKRLFLDFGDVVKDGMQFNKIKGRFTIKGEVMHTDNAYLDSVSARVRIRGETNLRKKTYDQTMIITPKIGDTLPIIGALTAGNAVGWGLLLIQKIFKKPIDKSVEIEYKVNGSWANPNIVLVSEKKLNADKEDSIFNDTQR